MESLKRIITRPDFDGVVCAVLLKVAMGKHLTILWAQPNEMQNGRIEVGPEDIIANLPIHGPCAMWFDHHVSNEPQTPFKGLYRVAPSAAGLIYEYCRKEIGPQFQKLVEQADKIDDARLSLDEILHPEKYPYVLLSMTISAEHSADLVYCDDMVELLMSRDMDEVMADPQVKKRCDRVTAENETYEKHLKQHTRTQGVVTITDFRGQAPVPNGNRFLVYSLFPETVVNMKIFNEKSKTVLKLGHSILNRNCNVNVGKLLSQYGGGGHKGAGACRLEPDGAEHHIKEILDILVANRSL